MTKLKQNLYPEELIERVIRWLMESVTIWMMPGMRRIISGPHGESLSAHAAETETDAKRSAESRC